MNKNIIAAIGSVLILAACGGDAGTRECSAVSTELECTSMAISKTVSIRSPYPATMSCSGLKQVKVRSGKFYWSNEGPFDYRSDSIDNEKGEVRFLLRTGNPGTYIIEGELVYMDSQNCKRKTRRVSAGRIRAQ